MMLPNFQRPASTPQSGVNAYWRLTAYEILVITVWMQVVFYLTQELFGFTKHEGQVVLYVVINFFLMLPFMLIVYVPLYLHKVRRHIIIELTQEKIQRN